VFKLRPSATLNRMSELPETDTGEDPVSALEELKQSVVDCRMCGLCEGRTQVVFGTGSAHARLLFVGEAPGFHEDKQGEPFVGAAGKLLTSLLEKIGLTRADVYIANVIKCRPPENRDPKEDEIAACSAHLMDQIAIIKPKVICTLGRFATRLLTGTELSMTAVHGKAKALELGGIETLVFPIFHPAAALYQPANRSILEEDFFKLQRLLDLGEEAVRRPSQAASDNNRFEEVAESPIEEPPDLPPVPTQGSGGVSPGDGAEQLPLW